MGDIIAERSYGIYSITKVEKGGIILQKGVMESILLRFGGYRCIRLISPVFYAGGRLRRPGGPSAPLYNKWQMSLWIGGCGIYYVAIWYIGIFYGLTGIVIEE